MLNLREWTMQEWTYRHDVARVDITGVDNAAWCGRGGLCRSGQISTMWQGWTMQEWTYRHDAARVDFAGVDNAARYGKGGHCGVNIAGVDKSALRVEGRMKFAHPNLYVFLGHLQRVTVDNQADITRQLKTDSSLMNDARIKTCINRQDTGAYTVHRCSSWRPWVTTWAGHRAALNDHVFRETPMMMAQTRMRHKWLNRHRHRMLQ